METVQHMSQLLRCIVRSHSFAVMYPLAFGLPATVPSCGCGAAQCKVFKSKAECYPHFDIHFAGSGTGGMLPKLWYLCTLQTLGRMLPKFWYLFLWLGHSLEHPKAFKLTSKPTPNRQKIIKSWYLGWLWAPPGSFWSLLGHHLGHG